MRRHGLVAVKDVGSPRSSSFLQPPEKLTDLTLQRLPVRFGMREATVLRPMARELPQVGSEAGPEGHQVTRGQPYQMFVVEVHASSNRDVA